MKPDEGTVRGHRGRPCWCLVFTVSVVVANVAAVTAIALTAELPRRYTITESLRAANRTTQFIARHPVTQVGQIYAIVLVFLCYPMIYLVFKLVLPVHDAAWQWLYDERWKKACHCIHYNCVCRCGDWLDLCDRQSGRQDDPSALIHAVLPCLYCVVSIALTGLQNVLENSSLSLLVADCVEGLTRVCLSPRFAHHGGWLCFTRAVVDTVDWLVAVVLLLCLLRVLLDPIRRQHAKDAYQRCFLNTVGRRLVYTDVELTGGQHHDDHPQFTAFTYLQDPYADLNTGIPARVEHRAFTNNRCTHF